MIKYYCINPREGCTFKKEENICDYSRSCENQRTEKELQWLEEDRLAHLEYQRECSSGFCTKGET
jgi:hypothetical protein